MFMAVVCRSPDADKHTVFCYFSGIVDKGCDFPLRFSFDYLIVQVFQQAGNCFHEGPPSQIAFQCSITHLGRSCNFKTAVPQSISFIPSAPSHILQFRLIDIIIKWKRNSVAASADIIDKSGRNDYVHYWKILGKLCRRHR